MSADRELLFGILALQNGLIERETLVAAFQTWMKDKSQPLAQILQQWNSGSPEEFELLNRLVELHINKHGQDPQKSLASISNLATVTTQLRQLGDPDIDATLIGIDKSSNVEYSVAKSLDPDQTFVPGKGQRRASGTSSGKSRFRILRPYARGGLGEVFVAQDEELNRNVALKEIQSQFADNPDSRSRFVLEAEVTGGLEHPGIVPVYGLGQYEDGRPYYAMRFIKGDSLKEAIDSFHKTSPRPFSPASGEKVADRPDEGACLPGTAFLSLEFRKLLGRFIDVCQAISYAHSRGVLHRDLKPGNIMLGKYGETLVVDWGLAKVRSRDEATSTTEETTLTPSSGSGVTPTVMGSAIGTPAYMPPEQAAGKLSELGPVSDVYSLGATLYHLLTGHAPFRGKNVVDLVKDVQSGTFPAPSTSSPGIPKALEAVCLKAMSLAPGNRYASPQNLADDIEKFLADEPVSAFAEPLLLRTRRWVRKNQTLATTTAAVLMVSAIGLGVFSAVISGKNYELSTANQNLIDSNARERDARSLAETNEKSAREQSQLALSTLTSVITDIQGGLENVPGGGEVRRRLLKTSLEKLDSVSRQFLSQASVDRATWMALNNMGYVILRFATDASVEEMSHRQKLRSLENNDARFLSIEPSTEQQSALLLAESFHQRALEIARLQAKDDPDDPLKQLDLTVSLKILSIVFNWRGDVESASQYLAEGLVIAEKLLEADPNNVALLLNAADICERLGDIGPQSGKTEERLPYYLRALRFRDRLSGIDSNDRSTAHELSILYTKIGEILERQGRTGDALAQFESALWMSREAVHNAPGDIESQQDFSSCRYKVVNALLALGRVDDAVARYEEDSNSRFALSEAEPNGAFQSLGEIQAIIAQGNVCLSIGRTKEAIDLFDDALRRSRVFFNSDPQDIVKQIALVYSLHQMGDVYLSLDRVESAISSYGEALKIARESLVFDPRNTRVLREMSNLFEGLGIAYEKKQAIMLAVEHYTEMLAIKKQLAERDPFDVVSRRDVAIANSHLGDAFLTVGQTEDTINHYTTAFEIFRAIAEADPTDWQKQCDLSISFQRLGDLYLALGRTDDAVTQYEESLKISLAIAKTDPKNSHKQRGLSSGFAKLGDVYLALGRTDDALIQFEADLKISRVLAEAEPHDGQKQRDQMLSHYKLGNVRMERDEFSLAAESFDAGAAILKNMIERQSNVEQTTKELALLESKANEARTAEVAVGDWDALLLKPPQDLPALLVARGIWLRKSLRFNEAAQAAKKLCALDTADSTDLYYAACFFSRCAASIKAADGSELTAEQSAQSREWINDSIAALKRSIAKGWTDFDHMQQDTDLTILYDLPEFKALIPPTETDPESSTAP